MTLSPVQERRLYQVEKEIAFLEKEVKKKNVWFALWFSGITALAGYITEYFIGWALDRTSLSAYMTERGWLQFLRGWVLLFLIGYFFFVRSIHQSLKLKKKELAQLKLKYGIN